MRVLWQVWNETVEDAKNKEKTLPRKKIKNHPSGAASRIPAMMEIDEKLVEEFPFLQTIEN